MARKTRTQLLNSKRKPGLLIGKLADPIFAKQASLKYKFLRTLRPEEFYSSINRSAL
ncbi:hypothetical protein FRC03_009850, partial [Tulasnella sp. 419]